MAPPKTRRPGFSRRAQYGLFFGYVVAVGGVLLALLLLFLAVSDRLGFTGLRGAALDLTAPVSAGGRSAVRFVTGGGELVTGYFGAAARNRELTRQLSAIQHRLIEARAIELENRQLKRMLKLNSAATDAITTARVVSSSFDSSRRLATIDAGRRKGVEVGQPVRAPEGLIGRIIETGLFASRVLLVTDGANNVPVRLVRDGTPALATGRGDGTIELKPLEVGKNPFKRGDILVTSGVGGIYPPGVPVAIVVSVNRDDTVARPLADPSRIDFAIVQNIYEPAANQPLVTAPAQAPPPAVEAPQ
nr:rod shape-determining protein MreC [uncultured Sphingosinicella sp.]